MASVTITFSDTDEGEVHIEQHRNPAPEPGEPLTPAQIRGFQALGVDVERTEIDETDVWEPPNWQGGPL